MRRLNKFGLLTALYVSQGLPYGFFTQALPVLLRNAQLSLPAIGFANLLTLPWALKFLIAPLVDRYYWPKVGLRKSWLVPLMSASCFLFVGLAFLSPGRELNLVLIAFLITNLLAATQDIAADGLAVDILTPEDRGWANGIQVGGYRMGMVIGGGALLAIYDRVQWSGVMIGMTLIFLLCLVPVLVFNEPKHFSLDANASTHESARLQPVGHPLRETLADMFHFLKKPGTWAWAAVLLLYKSGHASATGMLRPWLVDSGYSMTEIAWILGTAGFLAGLVGAMAGGAFASKFPKQRLRLLLVFGVLQLLAVIGYLWPVMTAHSDFKILVTATFDNFTSGLATAVLFTLMMDACSKERAATDYTLQACIVVIAQEAATTLSGLSAGYLGYETHFALSSALAFASLLVTALLVRTEKVRNLVHI